MRVPWEQLKPQLLVLTSLTPRPPVPPRAPPTLSSSHASQAAPASPPLASAAVRGGDSPPTQRSPPPLYPWGLPLVEDYQPLRFRPFLSPRIFKAAREVAMSGLSLFPLVHSFVHPLHPHCPGSRRELRKWMASALASGGGRFSCVEGWGSLALEPMEGGETEMADGGP